MKRIFLGGMLFVTGFIGIFVLVILSIYNPVIFNGIRGFYGFLLDSDTLLFFAISCILCAVGLIVCVIEAYIRKQS